MKADSELHLELVVAPFVGDGVFDGCSLCELLEAVLQAV